MKVEDVDSQRMMVRIHQHKGIRDRDVLLRLILRLQLKLQPIDRADPLHYRIIEKSGSGGMGIACKAEDLVLRCFFSPSFG